MKIKKTNSNLKIISLDSSKGLSVNNKFGKITIYDKNWQESYIEKSIEKKYRHLLYLIMNLREDENATEDDASLIREKIAELRISLLNKYEKYISKSLLKKYLKMLVLLEEKIIIPKKNRGR